MTDPNRRRLTVGVGGAPSLGAQPETSARARDVAKRCSLEPLLAAAQEQGKKFAAVVAQLDLARSAKANFTEKERVVVSTLEDDEALRWVQGQGVGYCCMKGMKPESPNQDCFAVLMSEDDFSLYCVLDGHGPEGHGVTHFVLETVLSIFLRHPARRENTKQAFLDSFKATQGEVEKKEAELRATSSGTTITLAYHDLSKDVLTVAHCGDSRAIFGEGSGVMDVTVDHKPDLPEERRRIEAAGGRVEFDGYYNHRIFAPDKPAPGLNMSRALGDVMARREAGLSCEPDVKEINLHDIRQRGADLRLLICTDGVWEFISSAEAMEFARIPKPQEAMKELARCSWDKWMEDSQNEIADDITGVLVVLSGAPGV